MRILDLTAPIRQTAPSSPELMRVDIEFYDHASGAQEVEALFGLPPELLRDGEGWARETITNLGTHNSTHVDAPWHYNSIVGGERAQTIDELPLEWFFGPGVRADFTHTEDGNAITAEQMEAAVRNAGHELEPGHIVAVHTGRDRFYGQDDYMALGPGVTREATRWLFEQGVRVMGIDAWSWDRPLHLEAAEALERRERGIFWAAHQCDLPYCQIERLYGLDQLPPTGFTIASFPLRIVGASAAPARVVAILE
jgi:kynurenine formamidase